MVVKTEKVGAYVVAGYGNGQDTNDNIGLQSQIYIMPIWFRGSGADPISLLILLLLLLLLGPRSSKSLSDWDEDELW